MYIRNTTFLLLLWIVALPATASAQSVAILGLDSNFQDTAFEYPATTALRQAGRDAGWSVLDRELALSGLITALNCTGGADRSCLEQIAEAQGVSEIVYGTTTRIPLANPSEIELEVNLYRYSRLERAIVARYTTRLSPRTSDEGLAVFATNAIAALSAGLSRPVVASDALDPWEEGVPTIDPADFPELDQPAPAVSSRFDFEHIGWPLVALAAVSFGSGIAASLVLNGLNNDPGYMAYQRTVPSDRGDTCTNAANNMIFEPVTLESRVRLEQARQTCSTGATLEIAQIVLYVVSGLSAVAGGILIGYDLTLTPSVGTDHAYLGAALAF